MQPKWYETFTDEGGRHFLFYRYYNGETEKNEMHQMLEYRGVLVDVTLSGMTDNKFDNMFDDFDAKLASQKLWELVGEAIDENAPD